MNRLSLFVLFFYCCTFSYPCTVRAVVPLGLIAPAVVGATVLAVAGTKYALNKANTDYSHDGQSLTRSMWMFSPVVQTGTQYLIGKPGVAILDTLKAAKANAFNNYSALKSIFDQWYDDTFGPSYPIGSTHDEIFGCTASNGQNMTVASISSVHKSISNNYPSPRTICLAAAVQNVENEVKTTYANGTFRVDYDLVSYSYTTTLDPTTPKDEPDFDKALADDLTDYLANNMSGSVGAALDQLMSDQPGLFVFSEPALVPENPIDISDYPPAQPINPVDLAFLGNQIIGQGMQDYIDQLQDLVNADPTNTALQAQLAEALRDQAVQQGEEIKEIPETFDSISDSPFDSPYETGTFDIPARFSSFMNNVQGSGLFSFSSGFFNSLPGGGSPVYTIEAGQYGTHIVDLSSTLGTGLAVLKTVLLLLFGFLSIRVVILKR